METMEFNYWWITFIELPVIAAIFWMVLKNKKDSDKDLESHREQCEAARSELGEKLSEYKLEVAKNYASINYLKDVERRLTSHLVRIENKLDSPANGNKNASKETYP